MPFGGEKFEEIPIPPEEEKEKEVKEETEEKKKKEEVEEKMEEKPEEISPEKQADVAKNVEQEPVAQVEPHIEERPFWGEFRGGEIDEVGKYKEPTPEQKEKVEQRLERLSEIFEDADFLWYLDGAINISLYRDKLMRDHKDLDMSVFKEDLPELDELLEKQGFGIFVNFEQTGKKLMRKVNVEELATLDKPDLSICKVDAEGRIQKETGEPFNFVDLHVYSRDEEGNIIINYTGTTLAKEFFEPIKKELPNGKEINLSQPAIVAYHKLHANRPYDLTDLQRLRPYLQERDFSMLREALEKEIEGTENKMREKLQEVWEFLSPMLEFTHDQKVISEKLYTHPDTAQRRDNPRVSEYVSSISQFIAENPEVTLDNFMEQSLAILKPREQVEQKLKSLDQLEESIEGKVETTEKESASQPEEKEKAKDKESKSKENETAIEWVEKHKESLREQTGSIFSEFYKKIFPEKNFQVQFLNSEAFLKYCHEKKLPLPSWKKPEEMFFNRFKEENAMNYLINEKIFFEGLKKRIKFRKKREEKITNEEIAERMIINLSTHEIRHDLHEAELIDPIAPETFIGYEELQKKHEEISKGLSQGKKMPLEEIPEECDVIIIEQTVDELWRRGIKDKDLLSKIVRYGDGPKIGEISGLLRDEKLDALQLSEKIEDVMAKEKPEKMKEKRETEKTEEVKEVSFTNLKRGDKLSVETVLGETTKTFEITIIGKRKDGLRVIVRSDFGGKIEEFTARMPGGITMNKNGLTKYLKAESAKEKNCLFFENLKDTKTEEKIGSAMRITPIKKIVLRTIKK
jgi:hypothetical protein